MVNFQISDKVTIVAPLLGHERYIRQIGTIAGAYKAIRSGAKSYAVSLPCPQSGVQVVTFAANELAMAPESNAVELLAPVGASVPSAPKSARCGGAMQCQRCGAPAANLSGISRCLEWVGGRRCGGAMEQL